MVPRNASAADSAGFKVSLTSIATFIDSRNVARTTPWLDPGHWISDPRLLSSSGSTRTVVWDWSDDTSSSRRARAIFAATFDGQHWRDTATILKESPTVRGLQMGAQPAHRPNNDFEGVVSAVERDSGRVALAWRAGGGWRTTHWRAQEHRYLSFSAAVVTRDGRVLLLIMGGAPDGRGHAVYALRVDRADTLASSPPVVIDKLARSWSEFSVARLGGDSLVVVWPHLNEVPSLSWIATALTVDGGRRWQIMESLSAPRLDYSPVLSVDDAGVLHMLYRVFDDDDIINSPLSVHHTTWHAGYWSEPTTLSLRAWHFGLSLGPAANGKMLAEWTEHVGSDAKELVAKSVAALWTPNCP